MDTTPDFFLPPPRNARNSCSREKAAGTINKSRGDEGTIRFVGKWLDNFVTYGNSALKQRGLKSSYIIVLFCIISLFRGNCASASLVDRLIDRAIKQQLIGNETAIINLPPISRGFN